MPKLKGTFPPNYRAATCCGACKHWEWKGGNESIGECTIYPDNIHDEYFHEGDPTMTCDDWEDE